MKPLKNYTKICEKCHDCGVVCESSEDGLELVVCSQCGAVHLSQEFDTLRYLTDLVHDGIDTDEALQEQLEYVFNQRYGWLGWDEVETMAKMMIDNLADQARFDAEAEDIEARNYYLEQLRDYRAAVGVV